MGRLSTTLTSPLSPVITVPLFLREPLEHAGAEPRAPVGIVALLGSVILTAMPVPGLPAGFGAMLRSSSRCRSRSRACRG